jgi:GTP-binding protein
MGQNPQTFASPETMKEFLIDSIEFHSSHGEYKKIPQSASMPQVAFSGRSNAGKSSILNAVLGKKELVKVSSTPGKTRTLNFFLLNRRIFLVDLPGFGYARASHSERDRIIELVNGYLNFVDTLKVLFILCDSKRPLPEMEKELIEVCYKRNITPVVLRTKVDKLGQKERDNLKKETKALRTSFPDLQVISTSTLKNQGIKEIQEIISNL